MLDVKTFNQKDYSLQALEVVVVDIIREQGVKDITDLSLHLHSINNLARWGLIMGLRAFRGEEAMIWEVIKYHMDITT